jgi:thioredoxin 1
MIDEIADEAFDERVLKSARPVLVDFRAEWCGPCQMLGPELEKIAASRPDLDVVGVDVDKAPMRAADYGITSIPAVLLFKGGAAVARTVGFMPADRLLAELGL